jgi:hypothetical protein
MRTDEHGNTRQTASNIIINANNFQANGIINNAPDRDFFKVTLTKRQRLKAQLTPNCVGNGNSGADVDLYMTLVKSTGDTIGKYNPKTLLNASLDTILPQGIYYLGIDGTSNQNVSDYGSVGLYGLSGSVQTIATAAAVILKGDVKKETNFINWNPDLNQVTTKTYIEFSFDGKYFQDITSVSPVITSFSHKPPGAGDIYYRVRMVYPDDTYEYSNTISLRNSGNPNITLGSNIISNTIQVRATGNYSFQLVDESGRLHQRGRLSAGMNYIDLNTSKKGLFLLKVSNQSEYLHFKLIRH